MAYTRYVTSQLPGLERDVHRLAVDLAGRQRASAERDWLTAHLDYERLGAAYGAFGDTDVAINGLPAGGPEGLQDRDFTGFHRIEYDLWHGRPFATLVAETATLSQPARERIDSDLSELTELLAPVAEILEPRRDT